MSFFKKLLDAFKPREIRRLDLMNEEMRIWIEQDIVNSRIKEAEARFDVETAEAKAKGDTKAELKAREKLNKVYSSIAYKKVDEKERKNFEAQIDLW